MHSKHFDTRRERHSRRQGIAIVVRNLKRGLSPSAPAEVKYDLDRVYDANERYCPKLARQMAALREVLA